nr:hypothetical protein CFP56_42863 [Quercus suber]
MVGDGRQCGGGCGFRWSSGFQWSGGFRWLWVKIWWYRGGFVGCFWIWVLLLRWCLWLAEVVVVEDDNDWPPPSSSAPPSSCLRPIVFGLGFEAEESGSVADISKEEEGGDGGDEEEDDDDLVKVDGKPC